MEEDFHEVMKGMTIENKPLVLSNHRKYCSSGRNVLSVMGRMLNPENQNMKKLIWDLPRAFNVGDRVRGVALSQDRFQFFFKYEEDLNKVLKVGAYTQDDWSVVLERWGEEPPDDYLKILPVWIRLYNIPVNYYTADTILEVAEEVGQVIELAFDPDKPQSQDFVRVRVLLHVERSLKNSKELQLPNGKIEAIKIEYERVKKRCFLCQKLTHDKSRCPLVRRLKDKTVGGVKGKQKVADTEIQKIMPEDPLFGIITDDQVGMDMRTGRPKMAKEVMDATRQYLQVQDPTERKAREYRVKQSMIEMEGDLMAQKLLLRLEPKPLVTKEINKDKGVVFKFKENNEEEKQKQRNHDDEANGDLSMTIQSLLDASEPSSLECSTGFRMGTGSVSSSGTVSKKKKYRKRPQSILRREQQANKESHLGTSLVKDGDKQKINATKRKVDEVGKVSTKSETRDQSRVDPVDPPIIQ